MICPGCHYLDDRLPNCLVCGGRGWLGEEKADTNCRDSTDGKKEVKVKAFAKRLKKVSRLLLDDMSSRYNGRDLDDLASAQGDFRLVATMYRNLALESRILYMLVQTLVLMACKAPQRSGDAHIERKRDVLAQLPPVLELLKQKNASYGDTALNPKRYFATGSALDMLLVRIDDKLNRIFTAADAFGEDALMDLAGYLVLAYLAMEDEWDAAVRAGTYCPTHRMPWNRCGCQPTVEQMDAAIIAAVQGTLNSSRPSLPSVESNIHEQKETKEAKKEGGR